MSFANELAQLTHEVMTGFSEEQKALLHSFLEDLEESGVRQKPLDVCDEMVPFDLPDILGNVVSSSDLLVKGPLVIVFYRGAWCPWCNLQLKSIQDNLEEIQQLGATLVAISPMTPDNSLSFSEKKGLKFEVLSDVGLKVAKTFGLVYSLTEAMQDFHEAIGLDLASFNGTTQLELLLPATYIVDDGIVVARVDLDFRYRMDPLDIIAALQKLGK
jgi:peroxiredoxin